MLQILGAKNCRKNLHKHPGPPFQIRGGPGSFNNDFRYDSFPFPVVNNNNFYIIT